ncbi:MAG: hypothetical protein MUF44_16275, partial [Hydrogenophaga sp.]|nr:hypothetical protein [Hydrogenophaga sp.]
MWIVGPGLLAALAAAWWLQSPQRVSLPPEQRLVDRLAAPSPAPDMASTGHVVSVATTVAPVPTGAAVPPDPVDAPQTGATAVPAAVKKEPRTPNPANARAAAAAARQVTPANPPVRAEPGSAEVQQVAAAPPVPSEPEPAPAPVASVDQRCASSGNFIARDVCRIRACGNPALAGDPVCV